MPSRAVLVLKAFNFVVMLSNHWSAYLHLSHGQMSTAGDVE